MYAVIIEHYGQISNVSRLSTRLTLLVSIIIAGCCSGEYYVLNCYYKFESNDLLSLH